MTLCPSLAESGCVTRRAATSAGPPGGYGTTSGGETPPASAMPTAKIAATKIPFLPIISAHHCPNECLTAATTITDGAPPNSGTVAGVAIGVQSGLTQVSRRQPGDVSRGRLS